MDVSHVPGVLLLGAGDRGHIYADWIRRHPDRIRIQAVADPDPSRREYIRRTHGLRPEACFAGWEDALAAGLPAVAAIVATQDQLHVGPATEALRQGLHVLLEKPMAPTRRQVLAIADAAREATGTLTVCHVLRYSSMFGTVKQLVESGVLGDIQSIFHAENVSYYHFAHSYVRGNWSNSARSSPLILAKSCHDLDLLCWIADSAPVWVSSTAGLDYFSQSNAPPGAPPRCTDGCPVESACLFSAESTYLRGTPLKNAVAAGSGMLATGARLALRYPWVAARVPGLSRYAVWKEWPTSTITTDLSEAGIRKALREGPHGRCVFQCDNDQPDHQETIIRFENGITATFRLHGRSPEEGRTFRIDGSRGSLKGRFGSGTVLQLFRHGNWKPETIPVAAEHLGHSEADDGIMDAWSEMVASHGGSSPLTSTFTASLASHLLAFAAHDSALSGKALELPAPDG